MPSIKEVIDYKKQRKKKNLKKPDWWPKNRFSQELKFPGIVKVLPNPIMAAQKLSNKILIDERDMQILEALHDNGVEL